MRVSISRKRQPSIRAVSKPTVVLPAPEMPVRKIRCIRLIRPSLCSRWSASVDWLMFCPQAGEVVKKARIAFGDVLGLTERDWRLGAQPDNGKRLRQTVI